MSLDRSQSVVIEVFKRVWLPETPTNKLDAPGGINVQPSLKRHSHVPSRTLKIKLRSCFDKTPAAKPVTSAVLTVIAVHHTHHQGRLCLAINNDASQAAPAYPHSAVDPGNSFTATTKTNDLFSWDPLTSSLIRQSDLRRQPTAQLT